MEEQGVNVSFFEGKQGKLWLTLLILSPLFAALFVVFAFLYADDGVIIILGCCAIAAVCLIVFGICLVTAKLRTSCWTADEAGVTYFCLGRKRRFMLWEEYGEDGSVTYPADDPLIACTRAHFRRPLRHEEFLTKTKE